MAALTLGLPQWPSVLHAFLVLPLAALLGLALGMVRPIRRELVPRAPHVVQTQVLLAIVGAVIVMVVAESLVRAFAIVGAASLVRYRPRIDDPKDVASCSLRSPSASRLAAD